METTKYVNHNKVITMLENISDKKIPQLAKAYFESFAAAISVLPQLVYVSHS